jgi:hypothetical protein
MIAASLRHLIEKQAANKVVKPVHAKAMPVLLLTEADVETWLTLSLIVLGITISFLSGVAWKLVRGKTGAWMRYEMRLGLLLPSRW